MNVPEILVGAGLGALGAGFVGAVILAGRITRVETMVRVISAHLNIGGAD